ncbi:tetratricopeptide repeat protein, partial [Staphylococcus aureus]|uniref:tetratricopeptide repeat protein n=1 Tax=Staphylococcus aureus TaxID=1280 RepID=UPI001E2F1905
NKASLFYKLSKPDSAIYLENQALKISSEFNNDEVNASAYGNIAECYWYKSQFDSAINYYFIAIKISEKTNNKKQLASYNNG